MADRTIQTATRKRDDYPLVFVNDSGETIPPFAVMEVSSVDEVTVDGAMLFHVVKPTGSSKAYIFNGPFNIGVGKRGRGRIAGVVKAKCSASPSIGDSVGPTSGSWLITTTGTGFTFVGGGGSDGIALVYSAGGGGALQTAVAKATDLIGGASGDPRSPTTSTDIDILYGYAFSSASNWSTVEISSGSYLFIIGVEGAGGVIVSAFC